MREYKFRAWWFHNGYGDMLGVGDKAGTRHPLDCCMYKIQGQPITLMQYTGLKDKNSKEIYEGDILECKCGFWRYDGKETDKISISHYLVKWEENKARWGRFSDGKFELLSGLEKSYLEKWYTVIGNMYENPQLLELIKGE